MLFEHLPKHMKVPEVVRKKCALEMVPVLSKRFHLSYATGTFPNDFKIA